MNSKNQFIKILTYVFVAFFLEFLTSGSVLESPISTFLKLTVVLIVFIIGIFYIFNGTAKVIEETTDVLKDRTGLAGGFLQSFGTAFPDMVIGVVAASISLQLRSTDYQRAVNLAILAAATTFGSNIYNILFGTWCVYRQNVSNEINKEVPMFPFMYKSATLKPINTHKRIPELSEVDQAIKILNALTLLTAFVAISMVLFGRVPQANSPYLGDLYQLMAPLGLVLFIMCSYTLFVFRKSERPEGETVEIADKEKYYSMQRTIRIWADLLLAGVAILYTAQSMVKAMEFFSRTTHTPFVFTGVAAGLIGCFGEMLVIYNFSINPKGRIGDAVVGVAMDNIVTTLGAAVVAMMGGIFLGGNSLILIFIVILTSNTLLISQISTLKNKLM